MKGPSFSMTSSNESPVASACSRLFLLLARSFSLAVLLRRLGLTGDLASGLEISEILGRFGLRLRLSLGRFGPVDLPLSSCPSPSDWDGALRSCQSAAGVGLRLTPFCVGVGLRLTPFSLGLGLRNGPSCVPAAGGIAATPDPVGLAEADAPLGSIDDAESIGRA